MSACPKNNNSKQSFRNAGLMLRWAYFKDSLSTGTHKIYFICAEACSFIKATKISEYANIYSWWMISFQIKPNIWAGLAWLSIVPPPTGSEAQTYNWRGSLNFNINLYLFFYLFQWVNCTKRNRGDREFTLFSGNTFLEGSSVLLGFLALKKKLFQPHEWKLFAQVSKSMLLFSPQIEKVSHWFCLLE